MGLVVSGEACNICLRITMNLTSEMLQITSQFHDTESFMKMWYLRSWLKNPCFHSPLSFITN
jgi:hypothetical protein